MSSRTPSGGIAWTESVAPDMTPEDEDCPIFRTTSRTRPSVSRVKLANDILAPGRQAVVKGDLVFSLAQGGKCVISALVYSMIPELTAPPLQDAIAKD